MANYLKGDIMDSKELLLEACRTFIGLYRDSDMSEECHGLYIQMQEAVEAAKSEMKECCETKKAMLKRIWKKDPEKYMVMEIIVSDEWMDLVSDIVTEALCDRTKGVDWSSSYRNATEAEKQRVIRVDVERD